MKLPTKFVTVVANLIYQNSVLKLSDSLGEENTSVLSVDKLLPALANIYGPKATGRKKVPQLSKLVPHRVTWDPNFHQVQVQI